VILVCTNPDTYPTVLISLLNASQALKWLVVNVAYPTLGLAIGLALLARYTALLEATGTECN
jgi:hypothetical protein